MAFRRLSRVAAAVLVAGAAAFFSPAGPGLVPIAGADTIISWPNLKKTFVHFVSTDPAVGSACAPSPAVAVSRASGCAFECSGTWSALPCGSTVTPPANYSQSFSEATVVTLTHGFDTKNLLIACFDATDKLVEPDTVTIGETSPFNVTVTFFEPQTGRCVVGGGS